MYTGRCGQQIKRITKRVDRGCDHFIKPVVINVAERNRNRFCADVFARENSIGVVGRNVVDQTKLFAELESILGRLVRKILELDQIKIRHTGKFFLRYQRQVFIITGINRGK